MRIKRSVKTHGIPFGSREKNRKIDVHLDQYGTWEFLNMLELEPFQSGVVQLSLLWNRIRS